MNKKTIKILYVARDQGGCGYYRMEQPAAFIRRMGLADTEVVLRTPTEAQLLSADLVVLQELGSMNSLKIVQFLNLNRIPYIVELDDFLHHVSPNNSAGFNAWNPGTLYTHRSMETARAAMALVVSTDQLAREYFPYNPSIYVMPNYLDKDRWDNPITKRNDGKIRIGWCGGNAHADDLRMISKVLHKIIKEQKGKVIFETMGMTKQELAGVFPFPDYGASCPHCGYEGELHHFPGEGQDQYPLVLAGKGWDIAVAPVIDNAFGNCKSDLKVKEYAAVGVPIVASRVVPYEGAVKNGAKIALATTFDEWYDALMVLIKKSSKRDEEVKHNREWIKKYWVQDNAQETFEIYEQVLKKSAIVFPKRDSV